MKIKCSLIYTKAGKDPKYSVGDKVRLTKKKTTFEKEYTPRWTEEVFTIDEVLRRYNL